MRQRVAVQQAAAAGAVEEDAAAVVDRRAGVAAALVIGVLAPLVVEPLARGPADDRLELGGPRQQRAIVGPLRLGVIPTVAPYWQHESWQNVQSMHAAK